MQQSVRIPVAGVVLEADVVVPPQAVGVVLFAHGSGSGRHSPRNRYVAGQLQQDGLATVLADLLTAEEERADAVTAHLRFDIRLLADRLAALTSWVRRYQPTAGLGVGLFGASTGAAAALITAAMQPSTVRAVVSRGGRPDLAGEHLRSVRQPTLLIVGGLDTVVIELNQRAIAQLACPKELVIVPGATHLFSESGTLEQVARLARGWFTRHLPASVERSDDE